MSNYKRAQSLVEYMLLFAFISVCTIALINNFLRKMDNCVYAELSRGSSCL